MASLIVGSIYLAHKGATGAYREKQRRKNYERWEGLRDEYDEQKKITRETRSLDIQRTGSVDSGYNDDRPIVSLRDLQEANDARTGWRPQESWEHSTHSSPSAVQGPTSHPQRNSQSPTSTAQYDNQGKLVSTPSSYWQNPGQIRSQKTGATWDDSLPAPLQVTRRNFDDYDNNLRYSGPSRTQSRHQVSIPQRQSSRPLDRSSLSQASSSLTSPTANTPDEPAAMDSNFIRQLTGAPAMVQPSPYPIQSAFMDNLKAPAMTVYPTYTTPQRYPDQTPGGRMAELIERGY